MDFSMMPEKAVLSGFRSGFKIKIVVISTAVEKSIKWLLLKRFLPAFRREAFRCATVEKTTLQERKTEQHFHFGQIK